MSAVRFEDPCDESIRFIAENMRDADAKEVLSTRGYTPLGALKASINLSGYHKVVHFDDVPTAVFGVTFRTVLKHSGSPWLLGTDNLFNYKRELLYYSPIVIEEMMRVCERLENYVHVDNNQSIRWLKWLGFSFDDPAPYGVAGDNFQRFEMSNV